MRSTPLEVLLVDDHTLFRESLRRMLEAEPNLRVCGDFQTADAAMAAISGGLHFDVALIDYELTPGDRGQTGLDLLGRIRALDGRAKVLLVTAGMALPELTHAVRDLQAGIFLKTEPTAELLLAIQRTAAGERWISSGASLSLFAAQDRTPEVRRPESLAEREGMVLRGILEGLSNKEIGTRLEMTESAVKAVLQKLFEKAGVRSRSQLVRYAIEQQIDV